MANYAWRGLMYSYTIWMKNDELTDYLKKQIYEIITKANNDREHNDPIKIRKIIENFETGELCDICGSRMLFKIGCPNAIKTNLNDPNYNKFQKMHYDNWIYNIVSNNDYSYLIERNKSDKQIQAVVSMNLRRSKELNGIKWCEKCQDFTYYNYMQGCVICFNNTEKSIERKSESAKRQWKDPKYKDFMSSVTTNTNKNSWKDPEYRKKTLRRLWESKGGGGIPTFDNDGNVYDHTAHKYISWKDRCDQISLIDSDFQQFYDLGFQLIPTFRLQDTDIWGLGIKNQFERYLFDNNFKWIVYIKLTKDLKPLVIGKSGSIIVNNSGSDLNFSRDENDGPSRKFLNDNNTDWCKIEVLIKSFDTEDEALLFEKEIGLKFNLFFS